VRELFARVVREHGSIDLLVNNAWGGHETLTHEWLDKPFWEQPLSHWQSMFDHGVRNHVIACQAVARQLIEQQRGLIVTTTYWDRGHYIKGNLFYDLAKSTMNRLAVDVAEELRPHGITSLALAPGWMRTEIILAAFKTDEDNWQKVPPLAGTESPRYIGRAVAALARDPKVFSKTGGVHLVGKLATEYGFTDIDGRVIPPYEMP
jgi:NAD(P)-dependent dehydrogenase (short-subunit alcohol dehydrogenase family)